MEDIKKNNDVEVMSTIERIKLHEREYLLVTTAIFMVIIILGLQLLQVLLPLATLIIKL